MKRLIILSDFTESFAHKLLKGIIEYSKGREPWAVCRMPPSYKEKEGIQGVIEWALKWNADAIIGQFSQDDDISLFRKNGIIALAQDYEIRFDSIPNITSEYFLTGSIAADFFLGRGFRNFAFFGYGKAGLTRQSRLRSRTWSVVGSNGINALSQASPPALGGLTGRAAFFCRHVCPGLARMQPAEQRTAKAPRTSDCPNVPGPLKSRREQAVCRQGRYDIITF